jgi:hypothetical protein
VGQIDAVFLPIMRTGETVVSFLCRAIEAGKVSSGSKPLIWSLIDISGWLDEDEEGGVRIRVPGSKEDYFAISDIKEGERGELLEAIWSKSSFAPTPIKTALERLEREFYSDEIWALIFEAGMQEMENDVPSHRREEHRVLPNFKSIIKYNGPLIAAKVLAVLKKSARGATPSNTVFLHPDEEATRLLAEAIYDVAGFESVPVSKPLVDVAAKSRSRQDILGLARLAPEGDEVILLDELESLEAKFRRDLTPGPGTKVVLLTEFHTTGRSILGLYHLARMFGARSITDVSLASIPLASYPSEIVAAHTFYRFG